MKNWTFFKDLVTEEKGGKYSSKKIWGHIFCGLVGTTYVMDGWHFYEINEHLFDSLLIAGVTLLGLTIVKGMFGKKSGGTTTDADEQN